MFKVDPEALRAAARAYAASAEHLAVAARYHQTPSKLDFYERGLILSLKDTHEIFSARLQDRLDAAAANTRASAIELDRVATAYSATDRESAGRLDAALTRVGGHAS